MLSLFCSKTQWEQSYRMQQAEKQISLKVLLGSTGVFLMFTALFRQQTYAHKLTKNTEKIVFLTLILEV